MDWSLHVPADAIVLVNDLAQEEYEDGQLVVRVRRDGLLIEVCWNAPRKAFLFHAFAGETTRWTRCAAVLPTKQAVKAMTASYLKRAHQFRRLETVCDGADPLSLRKILDEFAKAQPVPSDPEAVLRQFKQIVARTLSRLSVRYDEAAP